jgi:hypothetical protein
MQIFSMEAQKRCIHHCTLLAVWFQVQQYMLRKLSGKFASGLETQLKARAGEMSLARLRVFQRKEAQELHHEMHFCVLILFIFMVAKVGWVAKNRTSHASAAESQMNPLSAAVNCCGWIFLFYYALAVCTCSIARGVICV